jgi:hypothetical protein
MLREIRKNYPLPKPKIVNGVEYCFLTNTKRGSWDDKVYRRLQKKGKARILFEDALDTFGNALPTHVAIWLAREDIEKVRKERVWFRRVWVRDDIERS